MNFPKTLDDEDMKLFLNELRLAGYHPLLATSAGNFDVVRRSYLIREGGINIVADYTQRLDGWWVQVGCGGDWPGTVKEADAYELP